MPQVILRLALTTDGGKWLPGTVLGIYSAQRKVESFGPDGQGGFFLIKASTGKYTLTQMHKWRLIKLVNIDSILSPLSKQARIAQKENIRIRRTGKMKFSITLQEVTLKPRFDKIVNLDNTGRLKNMPIEFQPDSVKELPDGVN